MIYFYIYLVDFLFMLLILRELVQLVLDFFVDPWDIVPETAWDAAHTVRTRTSTSWGLELGNFDDKIQMGSRSEAKCLTRQE